MELTVEVSDFTRSAFLAIEYLGSRANRRDYPAGDVKNALMAADSPTWGGSFACASDDLTAYLKFST
jgi:hypothetical protein